MLQISTVSLLVVVLTECKGWVFNAIEFNNLRAKNLDVGFATNTSEDRFLAQERLNLIFPGTKWCGPGDIAENYDDLGPAVETDKCCREHDNCPDVIPAGETKHNLTNEAFYSRLSCKCDETFRQCLREVNTKPSIIVGKTYFNVIGTKCFRKDYPIKGCKRKGGWLNSKCLVYEYDTNGQQAYQWFDVPNFNR